MNFDLSCVPQTGNTIHAIFTDDSYNILISNDIMGTLFPGISTNLDVKSAIESLESWATEHVSKSVMPIGCFTIENRLYYIFRVRTPMSNKRNDKEVWAAPYTALTTAKTVNDRKVVQMTLMKLDYNYTGKPFLPIVIFPEDPTKTVVVNKNIGGSTGAVLVKSRLWGSDLMYVKKKAYKGKRFEHLREECLADRLYMEFGAQIPPFRKYEYEDQIVKLGAFLPGGKPIQNQMEKNIMQQHFIVDAFLANWDVLGQEADNVLVYNGIPVRIDNGGSLRFRAQGQPKKGTFSSAVNEIYSMRCKGVTNSPYCNYFSDLSDNDVLQQIIDFVPRARVVVEKLYRLGLLDSELKDILQSRIEWLHKHRF